MSGWQGYPTFHTNDPAKKKKGETSDDEAFDSQGYALVFEGAARDGVVGSKQTHMSGYVEQRLSQSTNGRPIEEDPHTVKDSDLMLS